MITVSYLNYIFVYTKSKILIILDLKKIEKLNMLLFRNQKYLN